MLKIIGTTKMEKKVCLSTFLESLYERGVITNCANSDNFLQLNHQERIIFWGVDCTGDVLHIGHLFQVIQLFRFLQAGFKVIVLLGTATSQLGDPCDKDKERKKLTKEEIEYFQSNIKKEIEKFFFRSFFFSISFFPLGFFFDQVLLKKIYKILEINENCSLEDCWKQYCGYIVPSLSSKEWILVSNDSWLKEINCVDFFDKIGRQITINYLLAKDWVKRRVKKGSVSFSAFSYSLLQAYDFYFLYNNFGCRGQVGGSDQWGNMTTGLRVLHSLFPDNKSFVISFPLLTDSVGNKIAKTRENKKKVLFLNSDPDFFFDFFSNLSDDLAFEYILKFTFLTSKQVQQLIVLNKPPNLRILQRILLELVWFLNFGELNSLKNIFFDKQKKKEQKGLIVSLFKRK